jgi:hypothetical protein
MEWFFYFGNNLLIGGILMFTCGLDIAVGYFDNYLLNGGVLVVKCGLDGAVKYFDNNLLISEVLVDVWSGLLFY